MTASAPNTWHSVRPRCSGVWAPLSIADKPRSRLWQARSVGRRWAQMLFWPLCPPPCCLPSGVGTCSEKEKRKEYSRSLRLEHSQTLSTPMLKTSDRPRGPGSCQELTGAWPQLRKVLRSEYTMSTFFFFFMSKRDRFDTSSSLSSPLSFPLIFLLKVRPNKSELHKLKAEIRVLGQMLICEDLRKIGTNKSTHWSSRLSLLFLLL